MSQKPDSTNIQSATIGVLGPSWTWSHLVALHVTNHFPHLLSLGKPLMAFAPDFTSLLSQQQSSYFIVPLWNSITGLTGPSALDQAVLRRFSVKAAFMVPIQQAMVACADVTIGHVKTVITHPAAALQCRRKLAEIGAEVVHTTSTTAAMEQVANIGSGAAIGPAKAAQYYRLAVLDDDVSDQSDNATLFVLVTRRRQKDRLKNIPSVWITRQRIASDGINKTQKTMPNFLVIDRSFSSK